MVKKDGIREGHKAFSRLFSLLFFPLSLNRYIYIYYIYKESTKAEYPLRCFYLKSPHGRMTYLACCCGFIQINQQPYPPHPPSRSDAASPAATRRVTGFSGPELRVLEAFISLLRGIPGVSVSGLEKRVYTHGRVQLTCSFTDQPP